MSTKCEQCGNKTTGKRFCSHRCRWTWYNRNRQPQRPNIHGKCKVCGKRFSRYQPPSVQRMPSVTNETCGRTCAGKRRMGNRHHQWKGGRVLDQWGYVLVYMPDHQDSDKRGYIREHRLKMEKKIGRRLTKNEVVHHIDGNPANNKIGNLKLYGSHADHMRDETTEFKRKQNGTFQKKRKSK